MSGSRKRSRASTASSGSSRRRPRGLGTAMIELDLGADARCVVDEVKSNIDAITTFPIATEKPIIRELTNRVQVVDIAVSGDVDPFTLKQVTERVRDDLTARSITSLKTADVFFSSSVNSVVDLEASGLVDEWCGSRGNSLIPPGGLCTPSTPFAGRKAPSRCGTLTGVGSPHGRASRAAHRARRPCRATDRGCRRPEARDALGLVANESVSAGHRSHRIQTAGGSSWSV